MIYKLALCDNTLIPIDNQGNVGMIRTASGRICIEPGGEKAKIIEAELKKHPTALFFRSKAIKANEPNSNGDYFSEEELIRSHKSFEGVPFFTNHDNQNVENARGKVIFAEWIPEEKSVYTISFVDREAYPHLCRSIEEEYINGVSMGFLGMETSITMGDLTSKKICDINIGDKVLTPYGNICEVENIYSDIVGKPMYQIDAGTYHKSPFLSDDHPVYIINLENINEQKTCSIAASAKTHHLRRTNRMEQCGIIGQDGWRDCKYIPEFKETKDIKVGDYILIPSKYELIKDEDYDTDFYYLAGAYVGDGYLSSYKQESNTGLAYYIGLTEKKELGEKICSMLPKYTKSNITQTPFPLKNGLKISIYDKNVASILFNKFGKLAHEKRIYQKQFTANQICSFISGYIDTDGAIARTYNKTQSGKLRGNGIRGAQISSCNKELLEDVQSLLILLDVSSYITWNYRKPNKNSVVKIPTTEYTLFIPYGKLHLFKDSIKINKILKNPPQIRAGKVFIFTNENGQKYMACPVKNITEHEYNEPCYDLKIKGDECYIADGIAVHNCSVEYSVCNICQNKAEQTSQYCSHIKDKKGRKFSGKAKNVVTGETKEFRNEQVFEYNYGIKFIELSAVVDPACPSCRIQGLISNDDIVKKVANIQNTLYMLKTSAIEKQAGKEDIDQLNETLKTLEGISIKLIQNRQQIEVEFASDLVGILSNLQTFVDELVGAGYGNAQQIPGVAEQQNPAQPQAQAPQLPSEGLPEAVAPVASETPIPGFSNAQPAAGTVSGAPNKQLVQSPNLPITAPAKPRAFDTVNMQKIAKTLGNLEENVNNMGEDDMGKRLTVAAKNQHKKATSEILSNSWKEKGNFFEYINKVPSVQDNFCKLSVKKRDDSFIIVAESKSGEMPEFVWTYETLNEQEKDMIKNSPKEASSYFLGRFASELNTKRGESVMTNNTREAGAKSVNKAPESTQEAQLEEKGLYHSRTNETASQITERQLDNSRQGDEKEVTTEAQLQGKSNKLNPRTETEADVLTEKQLDNANASPRTNSVSEQVTQAQLDAYRTGTDTDVIIEKQLSNVDAPWSRSAKRDAAMFKSAGDHMKSVISTMADTVISTGCTPEEIIHVASSLVASTKDRYDLGNAILDTHAKDDVNYSQRLAYWSKKNIKVAGLGANEIAQSLVKGLSKVASDVTINPETIIDAMDVISENSEGPAAISKLVDEKLASTQKEVVKASKKDELRKALSSSLVDEKAKRNEDRKEILASLEDSKLTREAERAVWTKTASTLGKADTIIETSFGEIGCSSKNDSNFKPTIKSFARGALASQNIKLAAITNVTISGDTISIAVQTDAGEQGIEIPVGENMEPADGEVVPEADMSGEGLGNNLPPAASPALPPPTASSKTLKRKAQVGGAGGGVPNTPGAVSAPGAPEAGIPGGAPTDAPVQSLTTDPAAEMPDEIPTAGEQQPLSSICPECGTSDVDVAKGEDGNVRGTCNGCGAEYEALVKKEIEFKIIKPTKSVGAEEATGEPEAPEVPALPVAAQTRLDKGAIVRVASNQAKHGNVCPSCGMKQCKASSDNGGHTEFTCPACNTEVKRDLVVNTKDPSESYLRVKWDVVPNLGQCASCKEAAQKFASLVRVNGMIKQASKATTPFPKANCIERIARKWGGNAVATFGPCKGKALADCVCGQLEKLGLNKVRHLEKLAGVYSQKDPTDECIADQMKKQYNRKEASTICKCLKKKFASKQDDNAFMLAFADDIKSGREKILTAQDLDAINDVLTDEVAEEPMVNEVEDDVDIGAPIDASSETVTLEVSKETAQELADAACQATEEVEEVEIEIDEPKEVELDIDESSAKKAIDEPMVDESEDKSEDKSEGDKNMAIAMQTHKILRMGEEIIKIAATPNKVKDIEGNVEAKVPRKDQKLGEEQKADSLMNKPNKGPDVPRKDAYMGKEKEADSLINKELKLPDVAVDSSYMGKENDLQKGMPAINKDIKGTVIAKKMKEVETVEKDVEAKVPRKDQKLGEESKADSLINTPNKGPDVPRKDAYMGEEKGADSLINKKLESPDVPIDNSYMGEEKEIQKGMPAINDEMLKTVMQKKEIQLERIATARRMKAVETAAKLLATNRITEDAYEHVVEALSRFELDKIASVADSMHPRIKKQASSNSSNSDVYAGPAIVMESKDIKSTDSVGDLSKRIASSFTIGNRTFDENLSRFGEK